MQSEGKLFHTRGPTTAKLRVPSTVLGLGTTRHLIQLNVNSRLITQQAQGFTEFTSLLLCALNCRQMQGMLISQAQLWALLSFAAGRRRVVVDPMLQPISLHISQPVPTVTLLHQSYGLWRLWWTSKQSCSIRFPAVQTFRKSVKIWRSYR